MIKIIVKINIKSIPPYQLLIFNSLMSLAERNRKEIKYLT